MSKPIVTILGRPNVGKSTLFNKIIGERRSIVEDVPGVTRDRIYGEAEWNGIEFSIIDTGGIDISKDDVIGKEIKSQAFIAMDLADVLIFMVDGKDGITTMDHEVAKILRQSKKKIILVVNKIDNIKKDSDKIYDFYELGLGVPIGISSANMLNMGDLLDRITEDFKDTDLGFDDESIKMAIIGKPNVGKSSLVNALTNENRVIVSNIAGTTRDSIDAGFKYDGTNYMLIDTAGLRRKSKVNDTLEKYSVIRAITAVSRCDICILMIDATEGITEQDKKIAGVAHNEGKGIIIAINKWDLIEKETNTMRDYERKVKSEFTFIGYAPIMFVSAKNGTRLYELIKKAKKIQEARTQRISTSKLNSLVEDAIMMKQPPSDKGKRLKIYYTVQIGICPPLFSFNINQRKLMHFSYARYLENRIREGYDFEGTAVKFVFNEKKGE